jgi:WD40 repeat protein
MQPRTPIPGLNSQFPQQTEANLHSLFAKPKIIERVDDYKHHHNFIKNFFVYSEESSLTEPIVDEPYGIETIYPLPSGKLVVSVDGTVKVWDPNDKFKGRSGLKYPREDKPITCFHLTQDGKLLCGTLNDTIEIWDINTERMLRSIEEFPKFGTPPAKKKSSSGIEEAEKTPVNRIIELSDHRIVTLKYKNILCVTNIDTNEKKILPHPNTPLLNVSDMVPLPNGKMALTGNDDGAILIIDANNLYEKNPVKLTAHNKVVTSLALLPGDRLASGSMDDSIKIWDLKTKTYTVNLQPEQPCEGVSALTYLTENCLACAYHNNTILIWDISTQKCIESRKEDQRFKCLVYLPSGFLAGLRAYSILNNTVAIWKLNLPVIEKKLPPTNPQTIISKTDATKDEKTNTHWVEHWKINYNDLTFGRELGRGGYGVVYAGQWQKFEVAIKQLHDKVISKDAIATFQAEAEIMTKLHSPYLIRLFGCTLGNPKYSLVMEYMPNGSLYHALYVNQYNLQWETRYKMIEQIAYGLKFLHEREILHRDMKSLNVLLDINFNVKLSDFGLSKMESKTDPTLSNDNKVGTLAWMAPELFNKKPASKKSDIYSMGMTFFEIVARRIPFQNYVDDEKKLTSAIQTGKLDPIPAECSPKISAIIKKCCAINPATRPSVDEVIADLNSKAPSSAIPTYLDNFSSYPVRKP